jgi:hypothetical protein
MIAQYFRRVMFRASVADLLSSARRFPATRPLVFGATLASVKTAGSDYATQRLVEGRMEIDMRRNSVFFLWGLLYLGGVQYFIQVRLFTHYLFPRAAAFVAQPLQRKLTDRAGQLMVAKQVGLDMFVVHPFIFFPLFYQLKAIVEGTSPKEALQRCWRNWGDDLRALWLLWIPAQTFNFAFCPVWARIPFVAVVSTLYTGILSTMRGSPDSDK